MAHYSIRDIEKISGVKAHTIRIWEKRYGMFKPQRTSTNIRFYSDFDLRKLLNILVLSKNGLKISKIAHLDEKEICEKVLLDSQSHTSTSNVVEKLVISMIDLDEAKFVNTLSSLIANYGIEDTFIKILFPFLERVGILWQSGTIFPAQEHFISNLIRQKLFAAIDSYHIDVNQEKSRFVLFLPEGELHEIGLLFFHSLLKKRGFPVIYLGQSLPTSDFTNIAEKLQVDYLVTALTSTMAKNKLQEFLTATMISFPSVPIIIIGSYIKSVSLRLPENCKILKSMSDFTEFLDRIN